MYYKCMYNVFHLNKSYIHIFYVLNKFHFKCKEFFCYVIPKIKNDLLTSYLTRNICLSCYIKQLKIAFGNFQTMLAIL